jgi:hypothetical protein
MTSAARFVLTLIAIATAGFLYNKHLNLEADRQRAGMQETLRGHQHKCAEDGKRFAEQYSAEEASARQAGGMILWDDPEYHYNGEMGACLVRTRFVDMGGLVTYQHARITDLTSNKPVLESYVKLTTDPNKTDGTLREEISDILQAPNMLRSEFVKRAADLMTK